MKPQRVTRLPVRALPGAVAPLLLLILAGTMAGGCAGKSPELRLTSLERDATFLQHFSNAYVSKAATGGTEIVLVKDQNVSGGGEAVPASSSTAAIRQIMHVKVLWKPQRGTKQSHPSYTNAGFRWYVLGDGGQDLLEYSGAGFVALSETAAGTEVTIRNATLKPVGAPRGSLTDPIGAARLTGTFLARKSPQRVSALLSEIKVAVDGGTLPQAAAE